MNTYWDRRAREATEVFGFEFEPDGDGCVCVLDKGTHVRIFGGPDNPLQGEVMEAGEVVVTSSAWVNVYAIHRQIGDRARALAEAHRAKVALAREAEKVAADPLAAMDKVEAEGKPEPKPTPKPKRKPRKPKQAKEAASA